MWPTMKKALLVFVGMTGAGWAVGTFLDLLWFQVVSTYDPMLNIKLAFAQCVIVAAIWGWRMLVCFFGLSVLAVALAIGVFGWDWIA